MLATEIDKLGFTHSGWTQDQKIRLLEFTDYNMKSILIFIVSKSWCLDFINYEILIDFKYLDNNGTLQRKCKDIILTCITF